MLDGLFKLSSHLHHCHPHDPGTGSQPVVPDQHHEGCGDQVEDPVQPVHAAASGQLQLDYIFGR